MGVVPGGGKNPDGKEPFPLAEVGGPEGCRADRLDDAGKSRAAKKLGAGPHTRR